MCHLRHVMTSSMTFGSSGAAEGDRERKEGGNGEGGAAVEDGEGGQEERAMGRGDFYDGIPGWTYFSRATPGHPASYHYLWIT